MCRCLFLFALVVVAGCKTNPPDPKTSIYFEGTVTAVHDLSNQLQNGVEVDTKFTGNVDHRQPGTDTSTNPSLGSYTFSVPSQGEVWVVGLGWGFHATTNFRISVYDDAYQGDDLWRVNVVNPIGNLNVSSADLVSAGYDKRTLLLEFHDASGAVLNGDGLPTGFDLADLSEATLRISLLDGNTIRGYIIGEVTKIWMD